MDVQVLYPNYSDLAGQDEKMVPELFNYCCIHGKAVYVRIFRKKYQCLTRGWYPMFADKKKYNCFDKLHLIAENNNWIYIMQIFKKCLNEMYDWCDYKQGELF